MKAAISPSTQPLLELFYQALSDEADEVKSNAAFATGLLVEHSTVDHAPPPGASTTLRRTCRCHLTTLDRSGQCRRRRRTLDLPQYGSHPSRPSLAFSRRRSPSPPRCSGVSSTYSASRRRSSCHIWISFSRCSPTFLTPRGLKSNPKRRHTKNSSTS